MIPTPKRLRSRVLAPLAAASFLLLALTGCTGDDPVQNESDRAAEMEDDRDRERDRDRDQDRPELPEPPRDRELPEPEQPRDPQVGGDDQAIHAYVELERSGLDNADQLFDGLYSDIEVNALGPSAIEYVYTYADELDPNAARAEFEGTVGYVQESANTLIFPQMTRQGVPSPMELTFTYLNADGSEIWSHTVSE